ncbi:hypothetical protein ACIRL3_15560 [Streptomyces sp. NPDC102384]|uniref:hypothetical protein n=1 Tax=Streptomyces sp. NPDC102384 TaxID=3366166 RepID=UPI0038301FBC
MIALLAAVVSIVWTAILRFVDRCGLFFDMAALNYWRKSGNRGYRTLPALVTNGPGWSNEREA